MNYDNRHGEAKLDLTCACPPEPIEPLVEIMQNTRGMAIDILSMTRRINGHLFGIGNHCEEKEAEPKCFRDALVATRRELLATVEELHKICGMLGI